MNIFKLMLSRKCINHEDMCKDKTFWCWSIFSMTIQFCWDFFFVLCGSNIVLNGFKISFWNKKLYFLSLKKFQLRCKTVMSKVALYRLLLSPRKFPLISEQKKTELHTELNSSYICTLLCAPWQQKQAYIMLRMSRW